MNYEKVRFEYCRSFRNMVLGIGAVSAKMTKDKHKVSFKMTENEAGFFMADDTNERYWPTKLG
ncbi:hypothetical protein [Bacillus amyloliquefaciens]|uniref:hypothetical protein n=1 Tax=Bacillus amyloliquefaciens TaxID=1390 RepID=UPI001D03FD02|nr:hypothetical protein [Bacillus amyloliquefaciens]